MMSRFAARLEACDPARDCYRAYRLEAGIDLLGAWLVEATYGRIGSRGRTVRHCLQRRATAPRRIGVPYQLRELYDPDQWMAAQGISQRSESAAGGESATARGTIAAGSRTATATPGPRTTAGRSCRIA